jgi:hypothetical protein
VLKQFQRYSVIFCAARLREMPKKMKMVKLLGVVINPDSFQPAISLMPEGTAQHIFHRGIF